MRRGSDCCSSSLGLAACLLADLPSSSVGLPLPCWRPRGGPEGTSAGTSQCMGPEPSMGGAGVLPKEGVVLLYIMCFSLGNR